jgi:S-formylglutathione hydrolase FrmB
MGSLLAVGGTGIELVLHDVVPGHQALNQLDGSCSVAAPRRVFSALGPLRSGQFASVARNRTVGYTIAYPPGHGPGSALPLVIALHGFGNDHTRVLAGLSPQQALALQVDGQPLAPMAMVAVDGGDGYWHAHPGDDPMAMVIDELIPMCQALGLGGPPQRIGVMGISMGGYGALLMAEKHPDLIVAVSAISPAIWTRYSQARAANPRAFVSADDFGANDVIAHAPALANTSVRVASGHSDPFRAGVVALARALPTGAIVDIARGCHTDPFFSAQQPASLRFLADHLVAVPPR